MHWILALMVGAWAGEGLPAAEATRAVTAASEPDLIGKKCAWSTSMLAQKVLDQGSMWSYVGSLRPAPAGGTAAATPFVVGPDDAAVLANTVLEAWWAAHPLTASEASEPIRITGKRWTHDGHTYVVPLTVGVPDS